MPALSSSRRSTPVTDGNLRLRRSRASTTSAATTSRVEIHLLSAGTTCHGAPADWLVSPDHIFIGRHTYPTGSAPRGRPWKTSSSSTPIELLQKPLSLPPSIHAGRISGSAFRCAPDTLECANVLEALFPDVLGNERAGHFSLPGPRGEREPPALPRNRAIENADPAALGKTTGRTPHEVMVEFFPRSAA